MNYVNLNGLQQITASGIANEYVHMVQSNICIYDDSKWMQNKMVK